MDYLEIKNKNGLKLVVTTDSSENVISIIGGMENNPTWKEYLDLFIDEYIPHFKLIKKAIEKLNWVGDTGEKRANSIYFKFSDNNTFKFSWRAWGDLMSAIVGKEEGYMMYYM